MTAADFAATITTIARLTQERDALNVQITALHQQLARLRTAEWLAADRSTRPLADNEREEVDGNVRLVWTLERVTPIRRVITVRAETRQRQADGGAYAWTRRHVLMPGSLRYGYVANLFGI